MPQRYFTPEEYLELECKAEYKSQYVAERSSRWLVRSRSISIAGNLIIALGLRFRGRPCDVYFSDMRLRVKAGEMYTYPDVMALCGKPAFETSGNPPSLLNPQVIFEVLSTSTEAFDRGDKFARYRKLDSLKDYVLVSVRAMRIEHHARQQSGVWTSAEYEHPSNILPLVSVDCELPLTEIYDKVAFPAPGAR